MKKYVLLWIVFETACLVGSELPYKSPWQATQNLRSPSLVPCLCVQSNYNGGAPTQNVRACVATTNPDPDNTGGGTNWRGDFVEGDLTGRDLLYDYLHDVSGVDPDAPRPWSSWVAFKIDGTVYNIRGFAGIPMPTLDTPPYVRGDSIFTVWRVGGVYITQKISPRQINGPGTATMLYEWFIENADATAHSVGILVQFDTMINGNDATRISTVYGYQNREQEFLAPNIPTYWQAWENDDLSGMVAQGDLIGPEATMPDRVCLGSWPTYYMVTWDYTPTFGTYDDSAVLIWFNPRTVPPGGTVRFGTYYGIGNSVTQSGQLRLNLNPVRLNCARCGEIAPNPFDLVLLVTNTYWSLFGDNTAYNVQATITYPTSCLTMVSGSSPQYSNPRNLAGPLLPGTNGETGSIAWRFLVNPDCMGDTVCFNIRVTNTNPSIPQNTINYCVPIPICVGVHPTAEFVRVDPCSLITSCAFQDILIHFTRGLAPIDPNSIQLWIDGRIYTIASSGGQLTLTGDDLHFVPSSPWLHGDTVTVSLVSAADDSGCNVSPITCGFVVDIMPPFITNEQPPDGSVLHISDPTISVDIVDEPAGVNPGAINVSNTSVLVNGVPQSGYTLNWDGSTLTFLGLTFRSGDSVRVCINDMWDEPDYSYCPPNHIARPYCWSFFVRMNPPVPEIIMPQPNTITACNPQEIVIRIHRGDAQVDSNSIGLRINGTLYGIGDPRLFMRDDSTLVFRPEPNFWSNGEIVNVSLESLRDINGVSAENLPLNWSFTVDLLPPALVNHYPSTNMSTTNPQQVIWALFWDGVSGFDPSHLSVIINDTIRYNTGSPALVLRGDTLYFDPGRVSLSFADNETVHFCVDSVMDSPDYCSPNIATYCFTFFVNYIGPVSSIITPQPNQISACNPQPIAIRVFDRSGIDTNSIVLTINGVRYTISDTRLYFRNDTLYFEPSPGFFRNGETVQVSLDSVTDIWGIMGTGLPLRWTFRIDYQPPILTIISPTNGATVTSPQPNIVFSVYDSIAGINPDSIRITVNGRMFTIRSPGVSFDGRNFTINTVSAGISFNDRDTVQVCVDAIDRPDLCSPNRMHACWSFNVNLSPPNPTIIEPLPLTWTACVDQNIIIRIVDVDGINPSTIRLTVNGTQYSVGVNLVFARDTLRFVPQTNWENGETVAVCLDSVADNLGNWLPSPLCWRFYTDFVPPYTTILAPQPYQFVNDSQAVIRLIVGDSLSGLNQGSIILSVRGRDFRVGESGLTFAHNETLIFNPRLAGLTFHDYDTVNICLNASDQPNYCGPNQLDTCYLFYVRLQGPRGTIIEPFNGATSACDDQGISILLRDDDFPVNWSTVRLEVNGIVYTSDSTWISHRGDTLFWTPTRRIWNDNDTVNVSLIAVDDSLGNHLQEVVSWSYIIDLTPPYITNASPRTWEIVGTPRPAIRFRLNDNISGVNFNRTQISINGRVFDISSPALWNVGSDYIFSCDSAGLRFSGGDTVRFCVLAYDNPDYCSPNELDTCWNFTISPGGPYPEIIRPLDNTYSACVPETVEFMLSDEDGIIADSIHFTIRRGPGGSLLNDYYGVAYPEIMWDGRLLRYLPSAPFADGETVYVSVIGARDSLLNEMSPSPVNWRFVMDLSAPVIRHILGGPGYVFTTRQPTIAVILEDSLSGIDTSSISFLINGTRYSIPLPSLIFHGDTLTWDAQIAGASFTGGDTISVCLHAADTPDYCAPNILDTCWTVSIQPGGPRAEIIRPFDGAFSSCNPESIIIHLWDSTGVDPRTIRLVVNGDTIGVGVPGLSYSGDRLVYVPAPNFGDSESVHIQLIRADDFLGNHLETPLDWHFQMDRILPVITNAGWSCGDTLPFRSPRFTFFVRDDLSGLDSAIIVRINGTQYDTTSPALYWSADSLVFDTRLAGLIFSGGDTVRVCVRAQDTPDYCEPNILEICCTIYILPGGPVPSVIRPLNNTYSSCEDEHIVVLLQDEDGIVDTTISFVVIRGRGASDTLLATIDTPGVRFAHGESLIYYPPVPFEDAETVYVQILTAFDMLGNPIVSRPRWSFIMDRSAPVILSATPAPMEYVSERSPNICIELFDSLSGILPESLRISMDGVWYGYGEAGISYVSGQLCANTSMLGLAWHGGDSVRVCVHAIDSPDYCEPNPLDSCYSFIISPGGPIPGIIMPLPNSVSACLDQQIWMTITDTDGVNPSTIRLEVDGTVYDITSPLLTFRNDTLIFRPDTFWTHEGVVRVRLLSADDNLGNPLTGAPISWQFLLDFEGPWSIWAYPALDTNTFNWQQHFGFVLHDSLRDVDSSTVSIYIDRLFGVGTQIVRFGDRGVYWNSDTIRVEPESLDITFTLNDSTFTGGYFAEFETIRIRINTANDLVPDYCPPNGFEGGEEIRFYVPDDDTIGPSFSAFAPAIVPANTSFNFTCHIHDTSGIYDDHSGSTDEGIYLRWDTDGEVIRDYAGEIQLDIVNVISPHEIVAQTGIPIPGYPGGTFVFVLICAYDNDFDFFNINDRTQSCDTFTVTVLEGPHAEPIEPLPNTFSACEDQRIIIHLYDLEGVDPMTIRLEVNGQIYTTDSPELSYRNDSLVFTPQRNWQNADTVFVRLISASDIYGTPLATPLEYSFVIDLTPPVYSLVAPARAMVRENSPVIEISVEDILSGVSRDSLALTINGEHYRYPEFSYVEVTRQSGRIIFNSNESNISFHQGDTVNVTVFGCDGPTYCPPNCSRANFTFVIEPQITCLVHPNPFTPNGDGYNDITVFSYPYMFSENAELHIFDRRNVEVYSATIAPISDFREFLTRSWNGLDKNKKTLQPGVYLYIIKVGKEVVCNGTVVIGK